MSTPAPTFHRCPHDKQNAYAIISRDLIRDNSISVECRWMLIYMLTHKDDWVINISQLVNFCKGNIGKNKVYQLVKEAIEAGYILKEEYYENNLKRVRYVVSESPKFKKCFRLPENQEAENSDYKIYQEKELSFSCSSAPPPQTRSEADPPLDRAALEGYIVATFFQNKIKKIRDDYSESLDACALIFTSLLLKITKKDKVGTLEKIITYAFESDYWMRRIYSVLQFSKHFKSIYEQALSNEAADKAKKVFLTNRSYAKKIKEQLKKATKNQLSTEEDRNYDKKQLKRFVIQEKEVLDGQTGKKVKFNQTTEEFLKNLSETFQLNYEP